MKKYQYLLLILCITILFTGCTKKEKDETLVVINNQEFHLTKETSYKGLNYIITESFTESSMNNYIQYRYYQEDNTNLLFFRIFYYENKSLDDIKTDLAIDSSLSYTEGKNINNLEYKLIDTNRTDGTIHFYIINKDNITYVVNFISQYDIKDFETKVLNSLSF